MQIGCKGGQYHCSMSERVDMERRSSRLIDEMERCAQIAGDNKGVLDQSVLQDMNTVAVARFFSIRSECAVIFSVIFILNFREVSVYIKDMARFLDTSEMQVARHMEHIEELERRKLVRRDTDSHPFHSYARPGLHDISYRVSKEILDAVLKEDPNILVEDLKTDTVGLLDSVARVIEMRHDREMATFEMHEEIHKLLEANQELGFVRKVRELGLNPFNMAVLLFCCHKTLNDYPEIDLAEACEKIFENASRKFSTRRMIMNGTSELITKDLLKTEPGTFRSDRIINMTDHAIELLFPEDKEYLVLKSKNTDLIAPAEIRNKVLHFNPEEGEKLKYLYRYLREDSYRKITERLRERNMSQGLNVLFYGPPGTGKTASAFQIARLTHRAVIQVDISNTKSYWYGESEKIIKQVFTDYRKRAERPGPVPILLFNECDAVFSKRRDIDSNSVGQTENAIQNIILQAMEEMAGIMIATTNLTINLDPAFERRFLFKVRFSTPSLENRSRIWQSRLPFLSPDEARSLAEKYDFTGGNIENIARKAVMQEVLDGRPPGPEVLDLLCRQEYLEKVEKSRIGFR